MSSYVANSVYYSVVNSEFSYRHSWMRGISDGRRDKERERETQDVPMLRFLSTSLLIISSLSVSIPIPGRSFDHSEHHFIHIDTMMF